MSREIALTKGYVAIVDDDDFDQLSQWKWCVVMTGRANSKRPYAARVAQKDGAPRMILMHRRLCETPTGKVVDHINRNSLDNRRNNLRVCTRGENSQNSPSHNDSHSSHYKGVCWHKRRGKWCARFRGRHLGVFLNEKDAALAYDSAAYAYSPEYAYLNFKKEAA